MPTVAESGLPGYDVEAWYGVYLPAGTPAPIVNKLNRDIVRAAQQPDVRERVGAQGNLVIGDSPEEFAAYIRLEADKWSAVVKKAGIRID